MASASSLLLDELYEAGDDRFVGEVLSSTAGKKLKALAPRWYGDKRPFARGALLAYLDDGCDRPHHRPLVKALFKLAEKAGDDEAMAHFLVAFDRFLRRRLKAEYAWDPATRTHATTQVLANDPAVPAKVGSRDTRAPRFSRKTRLYLARRAFRYFRVMARESTERYGRAIRAALALYQDAHLEKPEQLLDAWGLVHALYWGSPVLARDPRGVRVAPGRSLAELAPAPFAPDAWRGVFEEILDLVGKARSRTVRAFAIAILKRDYPDDLRALTLGRVRALLRSPHDEVQAFAAEILKNTRGTHHLSVEGWLELLRIDNPLAIPLLCELVEKAVSPDRLSLAQCVELACAKAAPVAELGLGWAKKKKIADEAALTAALGVTRAGVATVREQGTAWVAGILGASAFAKAEHVRDLVDARFAEPRAAGLALIENDARFKDSTVLWGALAESPYDDVRAFLVKHLGERAASFGAETLRHVWATSLLAVHRGGRAKRGALDQIAERIAKRPAEAESLLPLLGVALRSVRAPERRTAIAAVARAALREPALRGAIARVLPELKLAGEAAA
jgi:hypothetical protein